MSFLRKLFGKQQPSAKEPAGKAGVAGEQRAQMSLPEEVRPLIEENMKMLRYLVTSGKFDHDKMATYISMCELSGKVIPPAEKNNMLNAGTYLVPVRITVV